MAVYTKLSNQEISAIVNDYAIGQLIQFKGIKQGIENTNYFIKTKTGKFILTIFENRVDLRDLPFFVSLMKYLNENNFLSPEPLQNVEGQIINEFNTKKYIIVKFLEGKSKINIEPDDCFKIGNLIGDLQRKSKNFSESRNNNLSIDGCYKILEACKNTIPKSKVNIFRNDLYDLIEKSLKDCEKNWPYHLSKGIIHGDLFPDNVFFLNNKISGVIDFYFSCNDIKIYEIAIVINAWCFDENNMLNVDKVKSLIKGFTLHNKLTKSELSNLHILSKGASLRFLLTRLFDWFNTSDKSYVTRKDPKEYIEKLDYFNTHSLNFLNE